MSSHFIISLCYFMIASGLASMAISIRKITLARGFFWAFVFGTVVFIFCGSHYYLDPEAKSYDFRYSWDWLLALVSIPLAMLCNAWQVIKKASEIKKTFNSFQENKNLNDLLVALKNQSISIIVICEMIEPFEELRIVEYTNAFYLFAEEVSPLDLPLELKGLNFYKILPDLKYKWKKDHFECVASKTVIKCEREYWKKYKKYIEWEISPIAEKKMQLSFRDITSQVLQEQAYKDEVKKQTTINETLLNLGLKSDGIKSS